MVSFIKILCIALAFYFQTASSKSIECNGNSKCEQGDDQILFAHTLCRHGARNPYIFSPTDQLKDEANWPEGFAQLTNLGIKQEYDLGEFFRKRYASLLGNGAYSTKKVYVRSTDVDRTLASAQACLAGLFPPKGNQIWNENLPYFPIPIHTQPKSDDNLLAGEKKCDRFDYMMLQFMNGSEYTGHFTKYASLISYLESHSGTSLRTITDIFNLHDTLLVEQGQKKRIPKWAQKVLIDGGDFEKLSNYWYRLFTATSEMKKLRSGYLLKEILDRFTNKTKSILDPDRSLWMYFAHDITISGMLNSLGVFNGQHPPFASCVLFELYQGQESPYIQIYFKNSTDTNLSPLNVPDCGTKCELHKMYDLYNDILPTQSFDSACALRKTEQLPPGGNPENNAL